MHTIRLMNEFLHGPIWIYDDDDIIISKYPLISDDPKLQILDEEAGTLFNSFYDFDVGDEPCVFDDEGYKAAFPKMKELIEKIKQRLNEINDGSFTVEDYITNQKSNKELFDEDSKWRKNDQ